MKKTQISESFALGALLALVGGFLDAYTYLLRGGVFANAQTGNVVLLGMNLAKGDFISALRYLIPILAFAAGVVAVEAVRRRFRQGPRIHWRQIILAAECLLLLMIAFLPSGHMDMAVNVAVSFICSMQVESFRKMNGGAYATTMCTGNLRSGTELLYRYGVTRDARDRIRGLQYYGIILFFILGASAGVFGARLFHEKAALVCCALLALGFAMMFFNGGEEKTEACQNGSV